MREIVGLHKKLLQQEQIPNSAYKEIANACWPVDEQIADSVLVQKHTVADTYRQCDYDSHKFDIFVDYCYDLYKNWWNNLALVMPVT